METECWTDYKNIIMKTLKKIQKLQGRKNVLVIKK